MVFVLLRLIVCVMSCFRGVERSGRYLSVRESRDVVVVGRNSGRNLFVNSGGSLPSNPRARPTISEAVSIFLTFNMTFIYQHNPFCSQSMQVL